MIETILVPVDGSEGSARALRVWHCRRELAAAESERDAQA